MVAAKINFQRGAKRNLKPMESKDKQEYKGKNFSQNSSKGNSNNNKAKEKGVFKGKNKLSPEELERYRKENKCFKCGEQGHSYRSCPQRNTRNEQPRASMVEAPKEDVHCKGSPLSYAGGEVREHDAFILFEPGSTHNFISLELAAKLGVQDFEMGDAMKANGAFIGQDVSVTPLIEKLRLHIQGLCLGTFNAMFRILAMFGASKLTIDQKRIGFYAALLLPLKSFNVQWKKKQVLYTGILN
ncbi:hypothetical protein L7F22_056694 [Adiantum nelumboides]|nr:hypothetical protein [Adiantum nelumboides]